MTLDQQREFFSLAAVVLGCRLHIMGGQVLGGKKQGHRPVQTHDDLVWALLGEHDYRQELALLMQEVQSEVGTVHP